MNNKILVAVLVVALFQVAGCDDSAGGSAPVPDIGFDLDRDDDEVTDEIDNCPGVYNPDQTDTDGDGEGDLCDYDDDGDGVLDVADGCPYVPDPLRTDTDGDGIGDACDEDDDADGIADSEDACPLDPGFAVGDLDGDGRGDACDEDRDGDGVDNRLDNCPDAPNSTQEDVDQDGFGNECDVDMDGDGISNVDDNCRLVSNPMQADLDEDMIGDACDSDLDGDGVDNVVDNCPLVWEPGQADTDQDGQGNVCDPCPTDMFDDIDGDSLCATEDNCPEVANLDQSDIDMDGRGDVCDPCPEDRDNDRDRDGFCGGVDNCPFLTNLDQSDLDGDGLGDACDACPVDLNNDEDQDGVCGEIDKCPAVADPEQLDFDLDGLGDLCDRCPSDPTNDPDRDNVCNDIDLCPDVPDPDQRDRDGDGLGDACDGCLLGGGSDPDRDGVCNVSDNCPRFRNPDQQDSDGDGLGDVCDLCPNDPNNDEDEDRLCGDVDVCPTIPDPAQDDADLDGIGDRCDEDIDGDFVVNDEDNCPFLANEDQANTFGGPQGDVCELLFFYENFECEDDNPDCNPLNGWEQSGRWVADESAALEGDFGLVEGDNQRTQIVAINSPPIDLTRSERPRLIFWVRRQANQAFYIDAFIDRDLRQSFRVVGNSGAERRLPNGYEQYVFDLRGFEGRDGVRLRFRMTGQGGFGRLSFDEITVDENPRPPSVGIPFRDQFDTLENWRVGENGWSLGGPAWTPEFAATLPAGPARSGTSVLELKLGIDLRATRNPRLVVWGRTGAALQGLQRLDLVIEPANEVGKTVRMLSGDGNTLFAKTEIALTEQIGDPDVRIRFVFYHEDRVNPAVFIDSIAIEETPQAAPPELTPYVVNFPSDKVEFLTEGWGLMRAVDGSTRLSTTLQVLPQASKAKVRVGSFDLTDLRNPILRIFARYQLRSRSQALRVNLKPLEHLDRQYTLINSLQGGSSGTTERFDIPLNQVRGDRALSFEVLVETGTNGADAGVEIERIEIIDDPSRGELEVGQITDFEDGSDLDALNGSWTIAPNAGVDGSRGLVAVSGDDGANWGGGAQIEFGGRYDFSNVVLPRLVMDANFLSMSHGQKLYLTVESERVSYRARIASFHRDTSLRSEGFQRLETSLEAVAGDREVRIGLSLEGDGDYDFVLDNVGVVPLDNTVSALLQVDAYVPYVAYLNGERVASGALKNVAEAVRVFPVIGRNVLAIEGDFDRNTQGLLAALDFGRGFVHKTGDKGWLSSRGIVGPYTPDRNWKTVAFRADQTNIGDFEERADFIGLGLAEDDGDEWMTTGNAWGQRPDSEGSYGRTVEHEGGYYFAASNEGGAQTVGQLYSRPFVLDRGFLHFQLAGGAYEDGHPSGCTCARLWRLDDQGERAEVLATFTGNNRETFAWRRYDVADEQRGMRVQLEFADESQSDTFGYLLVDNIYLSENDVPRGVWHKAPIAAAPFAFGPQLERTFLDSRLGAQWILGEWDRHRYFRFEFTVEDSDGDGIPDAKDLCPNDPDAAQLDMNQNGIGDGCDICPACENISFGKRATATSQHSNDFRASRATDGVYHGSLLANSESDMWLPATRRQAHIDIDLAGRHRICTLRWNDSRNRGKWSWGTVDWRMSIFNGNLETPIAEGVQDEFAPMRWNTVELEECIVGDKVRFYADSYYRDGAGVTELEVFGAPAP